MILTFRSMCASATAKLVLAGALAMPVLAEAQAAKRTGGPVAGTWGAEAEVNRFGDGSVLRFLSPSWALLVGGSVSRTSNYTSGSTRVDGGSTFSLNAGVRRYHGTGLGVRPITGAGVNLVRFSAAPNTGFVFGEAGAAYFFTPHVSAGALARAGFSRDGDKNTYTLLVPRVMASVYF